MKQFLFMYPIEPYFRHEGHKFDARELRIDYFKIFNDCIQKRYRAKDFGINFAIFDNTEVDLRIKVKYKDNVFKVGVDFSDTSDLFQYPKPDFVLNQVGVEDIEHLRIAGFHVVDCVEKIAKRAHERGIDVLVDEDLTNYFSGRFSHPKFRVDEYPTFNPWETGRKDDEMYVEWFLEARKGKPWLFQGFKKS